MALPEWGDVPPLNDEDSDGENRTERNDYNIEQAVIDFDGESPIRHNVYPDTESDDEEEEVQRTVRKPNYNSRFHKKAQQAPQRNSSQVESSQAQE
uniref:Uncharacterized protein n=1 Tax=Brassica oleracea TaxID=3712 RepID=A0A3P6CFH8_BRAOL|nr:unnamed protein product [Brassica oleracea]